MKALQHLVRSGYLSPIDLELAGLLARRAATALTSVDDVRVVALAGALLSAERARGHSCLELSTIADRTHGDDAVGVPMPDLETCRRLLERSGLCADGVRPSPLVLDGDRLYLYRFHAAERRLAAALTSRVAAPLESASALDDETVRLFRACFDVGPDRPIDWQAVAAAAAMRNPLTVITGGPGTGKTHAVARVLALLLARDPALRIAVAAPTGKAAARLAESLRSGAAVLPISQTLRDALPREGQTLHRLLGWQPRSERFARDAARPLADDVIVVDEASMVDLLVMDALFAATRPNARIILLGDQDQLASVDTGYVLGDVCRAADACGSTHGVELAAWFERLAGRPLDGPALVPALRDTVVRLRRSFRFERQPGIGALAESVREGRSADALAALGDERYPDVIRREPLRRVDELLDSLAPMLESCFAAPTAEEALACLGSFRILSALREGRVGVSGLNDAIERSLRERGLVARTQWYDRRPVLVTANDPGAGLYNGDVGVAFRADGRTLVHFAMRDGIRAFAPSRVPMHVTAWAMTVHKSQGSEFDEVALVLPDADAPVVTRELLYTAITRARRRVTVYGSEVAIARAVERVTRRASGLAARLT